MATTTKTTAEATELAQKIREQALSSVKQGQQMFIDAAQTWGTALSALPVAGRPEVPGLPAVPDLKALTAFTFDVAADLLHAQRDFASQLANVLTSSKSV